MEAGTGSSKKENEGVVSVRGRGGGKMLAEVVAGWVTGTSNSSYWASSNHGLELVVKIRGSFVGIP